MKLNVDKAIRRAQTHVKKGETAQAEEVYSSILVAFPQNKRAQQGLERLKSGQIHKSSPQRSQAPQTMPREGYDRLVALFREGSFEDVVRFGEPFATQFPNDIVLLSMLGAANAELDRLDQATVHYRRLLDLKPDYPEGQFNFANVLKDKGLLDEAAAGYARAIRLRPGYAEAHYNLGVLLQDKEDIDGARAAYLRALQTAPDHAKAHNNLGALDQKEGDLDAAASRYQTAIENSPDYAEAHNNLGGLYQERGMLEAAAKCYRRATAINPDYAEAFNNLATALHGIGTLEEAAKMCRRALGIRPDYAEALNTLGVILQDLGDRDEAAVNLNRAVEIDPDYGEALNSLGVVLREKGDFDKAVETHARAVDISPHNPDAHNNLGVALKHTGSLDEAIDSFHRALEINPDYFEAHNNLGVLYQQKGAFDEAVASFKRALEIDPDYDIAYSQMLHQQAHMCDWAAIAESRDAIERLGIRKTRVSPFSMVVLDDDPARNRIRSEIYTSEKYTRPELPGLPRPSKRPKRLRIGYFSADFHSHATMHLMAKLFAEHDRDAFEIYAYSFGRDSDDEMRQRLIDGVDVFRDVRTVGDETAARMARDDGIDIAVDLKGHTRGARTGILAFRPAPVQIAYLGYPGTTGAPFIDYVIADETVIPPDAQEHYSEKVIYLPNSYQVNDDSRRIAEYTPTRAECGLPETGFVFGCFNANYKITPAEFDVWMRLLQAVEGSVLWLLDGNKWSEANLRAEAEARDVDGERIVFAKRRPLEEHLARCRQADLFLDTFTCNAHTTASDALWAGLPVITKLGEGFAARVAGSLLRAVGLPELVTETTQDYEALALELATNPERHADIKSRLAQNRETEPLFDTALFAEHLEAAYQEAYRIYFDGHPPASFRIEGAPLETGPARLETACAPKAPDQSRDLPDGTTERLLAHYSAGRLDDLLHETGALTDSFANSSVLHGFAGAALAALNRPDAAVESYRRALEIAPDNAAMHFACANVLRSQNRLDEAEAGYRQAVELDPDHADTRYNLGLTLQERGEPEEAIGQYSEALRIDPDHDRAREQKCHQLARICDWQALADEAAGIAALGIEGPPVSPFSLLAMEDDPARHRARSERMTRALFPDAHPRPQHVQSPDGRIRIGYFSSDFHDHATMYLMAGLFAHHDHDAFEVHAYSYGPDKQDAMRQRLVASVKHLHDVRGETDDGIAEMARGHGIDIAVDLKGYTQGARLGIFARRAAPVQMTYLGYPGTTGAPFIDYVIADGTVIPEGAEAHYTENVIRMPHSYQVNDRDRRIADSTPTRAECGLPDGAFVFCCFNSSYKIGPDEFDIWMRLLARIPGSVLWLLRSNQWAEANLRSEAEARGISGARLVFADRLPHADHLARYPLADLFLDTFIYNAHTTASDALWTGLPVITRLGEGFAARVAGSLLYAAGMPELVTESAKAYEALALELARDPDRRSALRALLGENRDTCPLFDTALFTRHLEGAYREAHRLYVDGSQPASFAVETG